MDQAAIWQVWGPLLTIALILLIRARRIGKERRLKLRTLWIVPVLLIVAVAAMFISMPPPPIGWFALAAGLPIGAAIGWRRGKMMTMRVESETGHVWHTASAASFLLVLAIIAMRIVVKDLFGGDPTRPNFVPAAVAVTDLLMGVAVGVIVFTRLELYVRARAMLKGDA